MNEVRKELPVPSGGGNTLYGSDAIADALRLIDLPYLALTPGASFRGLHDSLVNHLGNTAPQLLLVIHEETAISIAHGHAKVAGKMMGAVLHSNVGLMHGCMGIFNAWCDRVPMVVIGAVGPLDAARRRPWIDWIHTSSDQASIIRDYTKWDDQPGSVPAAQEAIVRAAQIARTAPCGPTYVNLDVSLQEAPIAAMPPAMNMARFAPPPLAAPADRALRDAAAALSGATRPLILVGRVGRSEQGWADRVALAEKLDAEVIFDLRGGANFPTGHPLLGAVPDYLLGEQALAKIRAADVILSLDWVDLGGVLHQACGDRERMPQIVQISLDQTMHRGWSKDYFSLPPIDHYLFCDPDVAVPLLTEAVKQRVPAARSGSPVVVVPPAIPPIGMPMVVEHIADAINAGAEGANICLARLPLGWSGSFRHFSHPLDYLGYDGGAGVGSGPGMAIGTALALKGSGRTTVAVLGDGDFMMNCSAVWTAVHYDIPLLFIIANNQSFYNDEAHQERVALHRGRPVENKWIGLAIADPDIDIAAIGAAQGAHGIGPVHDAAALRDAVIDGLRRVRDGQVVVIDARVAPGYATNLSGEIKKEDAE